MSMVEQQLGQLFDSDHDRGEIAGRRVYENNTGVHQETEEQDESLGDSEPSISETNINEIVLIAEVQTFCSNTSDVLNVYHFDPVMNHRTKVREIRPQPEELQKNAIFPGKKEDQAIIKRITEEQYEQNTEDFNRLQIDDIQKFVFNNEQGTPLSISRILLDAKYIKSTSKTLHQYEKQGGFEAAKNDLRFLSTQPIEERADICFGEAGNIELNARKTSTYKIDKTINYTDKTNLAATVEMKDINNTQNKTKFRYTSKDNGATGETRAEYYDIGDKGKAKKAYSE